MIFDSSSVQNNRQVLSVRSNKQGCNQLFGFNNVKRNSSTQLDCQNLQPESTLGSRLGSMRGLAARIKRFYSMQFDGQVSKVLWQSKKWSSLITKILKNRHYPSTPSFFKVDDGQFVSQARIEAVNRRCDSYNKVLIVSILIFNAIIIAFITFLFFFPFQKYELWTISLTVYMQFKSFIHRWTCKRKRIKSRANHVLIHVTCFLWVMWSWRWLSRIFDDNKGLTFIFADILKKWKMKC